MNSDLQKQDETFMRKALAEAQAAFEEGEIPVGAVVVCQGRIISNRDIDRRYCPCRNAGNNSCGKCSRRQISDRLHPIRNGRALSHVCRCHRMGTDSTYRIWSKR